MPKRIATDPGKITGFKAAPGRPRSNTGSYILRATPRENSGFTMLNTTPQAVSAAKEHYMSRWELPPALAPTRLRRPEVLQRATNQSISRGFVNPKSHQV